MKIFKLIKMTKSKILNYIVEQMEELDLDIQNIFSEVISDKERSIYQLKLFQKKVELLELKKAGLEKNLKEYEENIHELHRIRGLYSLMFLLIVGTALIMFDIFFAYGIIYMLYIWGSAYTNKLIYDYDQAYKKLEPVLQLRSNTLFSSRNIINKKLSKKKEAVEKLDVENDISLELKANKMISEYIDNGILMHITDEVSKEVIKILQYELNCDSDEVLILLDQAKKEIKREEKNVDLVRVRGKDDENN